LSAVLVVLVRRQRSSTPPSIAIEPTEAEQSQLLSLGETIASLTKQLAEKEEERKSDVAHVIADAESMLAERTEALTHQLRAEFAETRRQDNARSNLASRGALLAKVMEHIGPLLPGFPYPLKEVRHVGEIFDFLVYEGLESGGEVTVIFLEVKTSSTGRKRRVTNPRERALREAIRHGRVRYEVWQPPSSEKLAEIAAAKLKELETSLPEIESGTSS
jgi:predicted Holliday junction resolvase-like endonuclease